MKTSIERGVEISDPIPRPARTAGGNYTDSGMESAYGASYGAYGARAAAAAKARNPAHRISSEYERESPLVV